MPDQKRAARAPKPYATATAAATGAPTGGATGHGMITFTCEGCGYHITAFGIACVPPHGLCATCAWLCEHVPDPEEMMTVRSILRGAETRRKETKPHGGLGQ